jgi:hypothetical protein
VRAKLEKDEDENGVWEPAISLKPMNPAGGNSYEVELSGPLPEDTVIQGVVIAEWKCAAYAEAEASDDGNTGQHP